MKYACFTVSQPETSPEESLIQLKDAGYNGVEWRITNDEGDTSKPGFWSGNRCTLQSSWSDAEFQKVARLQRSMGLECPNLGTYLQAKDKDAVERMLAVAQMFDAPSIRVGVSGYNGSKSYQDALAECVAEFNALVPLSQRYGVRLVVEIHHGNIIPSASAAYRFASHFNPARVGVIHDAGNMVHEGYENYQMGLEILGGYLAHVHIKNALWSAADGDGAQTRIWRASWAPMREGVVHMGALMKALRAVGYDGWLSFEDFSTAQPQAARVGDNLAFMKAVEAETSA
ncbi:MAG: sugar phosphate isomerase/epimerase [Candidatus Poribacteria bacterium]|nr:sugar phosphate isomerase/epimerase [Candidatus Poribacteria bacterium]